VLAAAPPPAPAAIAQSIAVAMAQAGPRPAGSARERRVHDDVARRFAAAGLVVRRQRFRVPGHGHSRNVIGIWTPAGDPPSCLRVLMAHADTVPPSPGAHDNGSGVGVISALAERLDAIAPRCEVWLVATGAEERIYTGSPDHLGSLALTKIVPRDRLRYALSLDEVGRGRRFTLRSPVGAPRRRVEGELLAAARRVKVRVNWAADSGTGNSDHREFELAGMCGVKLGVPDEPVRHTAGDVPSRLQRGAFRRALAVVEAVLSR
jgi:Zn-dependent M28 family amino/carboxypeptidase